jgi:hypothetical protein
MITNVAVLKRTLRCSLNSTKQSALRFTRRNAIINLGRSWCAIRNNYKASDRMHRKLDTDNVHALHDDAAQALGLRHA